MSDQARLLLLLLLLLASGVLGKHGAMHIGVARASTVGAIIPSHKIPRHCQSTRKRIESDLSLTVSPTSKTHLTVICIAHK